MQFMHRDFFHILIKSMEKYMDQLQNLCKEKILSEQYMDFIYKREYPDFFDQIPSDQICVQKLKTEFYLVYMESQFASPLTLERFSYGAIPKCYTLLSTDALEQSGIFQVQNYPLLQLKGNGVMIGFIDTGIDYENKIFRNEDGSTRIAGIWDQTIQSGEVPKGMSYGSEYTKEMIDEALKSSDPKKLVPSKDSDGHGTFIASIAAGGEDLEEQFLGAAPYATIGVVKLKEAKQYLKDFYFISRDISCFQENDIMLGIQYLDELAKKKNQPLVLCLALGTNMGDHNGSSPLAAMLSEYASVYGRAVVTGAGNEANQRHHYYGRVKENQTETIEIRAEEGVEGFIMELWTEIPNIFIVSIVSPGGERMPFTPIRQQGNGIVYNFVLEKTRVFLDYRLFVERTNSQLVFLRFEKPVSGIWKIEVKADRVSDGKFHMWLPASPFLRRELYFLVPNPDWTVTEPGCVWNIMTAAHFNGDNNSIAIDSGRGYTRNGRLKPDFAAPGIKVRGLLPGGRFEERSGSSISAAITAGACVLLMDWLYYQTGKRNVDSMQIKNLLILGTERDENELYPNRQWGYGSLDLFQTFEVLQSL